MKANSNRRLTSLPFITECSSTTTRPIWGRARTRAIRNMCHTRRPGRSSCRTTATRQNIATSGFDGSKGTTNSSRSQGGLVGAESDEPLQEGPVDLPITGELDLHSFRPKDLGVLV